MGKPSVGLGEFRLRRLGTRPAHNFPLYGFSLEEVVRPALVLHPTPVHEVVLVLPFEPCLTTKLLAQLSEVSDY